jgi:hypothetical protein
MQDAGGHFVIRRKDRGGARIELEQFSAARNAGFECVGALHHMIVRQLELAVFQLFFEPAMRRSCDERKLGGPEMKPILA